MHCEICGKTTTFGKKIAHDRMYVNRRTNIKVKPNLQTMHIFENGARKKIKACTRCMRTMRKNAPA
jgi:large subunit ribosomal protein L28